MSRRILKLFTVIFLDMSHGKLNTGNVLLTDDTKIFWTSFDNVNFCQLFPPPCTIVCFPMSFEIYKINEAPVTKLAFTFGRTYSV